MAFDWQYLAAWLLVAGCAAYAAWTLMPGRLRMRCRAVLGLSSAGGAGGCAACDGCGPAPLAARRDDAKAAGAAGAEEQVVHFMRHPPRG